jgi:hypothetical protein
LKQGLRLKPVPSTAKVIVNSRDNLMALVEFYILRWPGYIEKPYAGMSRKVAALSPKNPVPKAKKPDDSLSTRGGGKGFGR